MGCFDEFSTWFFCFVVLGIIFYLIYGIVRIATLSISKPEFYVWLGILAVVIGTLFFHFFQE